MADYVTIRIAESNKDNNNNNSKDSSPSFVVLYSTNLRKKGLPEVLAVDVEPEAAEQASKVLQYCATCMLNSGAPMPHLQRRFLRHKDEASSFAASSATAASYVSFLQVTDPDQVKTLCKEIMADNDGEDSPSSLILVMPVVSRYYNGSTSRKNRGILWGQVPPAPNHQTKIRNTIWSALEEQKQCQGFLLLMSDNNSNNNNDNGGKENASPNYLLDSKQQRVVTLQEALEQPTKILWNLGKPKLVRYLEQYTSHFATLAIDEIGPESAAKYMERICENASVASSLYFQGETMGGK